MLNQKKYKMSHQRLPLGIIPEWLHKEHRRDDIEAAIKRAQEANVIIPDPWVKELAELNQWLNQWLFNFSFSNDNLNDRNKSMEEGLITKIKIDQKRDFIIIEKEKGGVILADSMLYCGCCGNSLAQARIDIKLPVNKETFKAGLKTETITFLPAIIGGLHHETCKHAMFIANKNGWAFISLLTYQSEIKKIKTHEN